MFVSSVRPVLPSSGKTTRGSRREQSMTIHDRAANLGRCLGDVSHVDVVQWRLCRLLQAGFPADLAARLAGRPGIDVHALLALVDRGCPPDLAARILAPLPLPGEPA